MKKTPEIEPVRAVEKGATRALTTARSETIRRAAVETAARWFVVSTFFAVAASGVGRFFSPNGAVYVVWIVWGIASAGLAYFLARRRRDRFPTPFELARRFERRFPKTAGVLTAAVDFERDVSNATTENLTSNELRNATIRGAVRSFAEHWRELDAAERFAVVWNVAPKGRRTFFDVAAGVAAAAIAVGVATSGDAINNVDGANCLPNESRSSVDSANWTADDESESPPAFAPGPDAAPSPAERAERAETAANESETADELESFVADLARSIGVAEGFAVDLRRRADAERSSFAASDGVSDVALLQTAREIEALVDAPEKGVLDRLKRLGELAKTDLQTNAASKSAPSTTASRRFTALLTAVRAREFRDELAVDLAFRATARLGATARGASVSERIATFDETARRQEAFAERLRRERFVWSILAASRQFDARRRELRSTATALFETTRAALTRTPGRTALEFESTAAGASFENGSNGAASEEISKILARTDAVQVGVDGAFAEFERLRDRLTSFDAADFLAFVGRVGRENGVELLNGKLDGADVERLARDCVAKKKTACDEIAANAANGRFGAALEIVEKTNFAKIDVASAAETANRAKNWPKNLTDSSTDGAKGADATVAAALLTFGVDFQFDAKRPDGAAFAQSGDVDNGRDVAAFEPTENVGESNGAELDFTRVDAEPSNFADLSELAAQVDKVLEKNELKWNEKQGTAVGNSPDSAFEGGVSENDSSESSRAAAPLDPFWNELPNAERKRLQETLSTEIPPEFAEKLRLYRERVFREKR